jgi:hypothetical protein
MISGSGFIASSSVTFSGASHPASLVSASQLNITLTASDLATAGSFPIVVMNPPPGGGSSNTITFVVQPSNPSTNPVPTITSLSPPSIQSSAEFLVLTINGSGFIPSSSVTFNQVSHASSFVNGNQLMTALNATDLSTTGSFPVVVTNPAPGGGDSNAAFFTVEQGVAVNLAGTWQGTWRSNLGASGSATASLTQLGSTLGGTISLANSCFLSGTLAGTISGNNINLNLTFSGGQSVAFSGATNLPGNAISGQYTVTAGSCADGNTGGLTVGRQ